MCIRDRNKFCEQFCKTQGLREPHLPIQVVLRRQIKVAKIIRLTVIRVTTPEIVTSLVTEVTMLLITKTKTGTLLVAVTMIIARILIIQINNLIRQGLVI